MPFMNTNRRNVGFSKKGVKVRVIFFTRIHRSVQGSVINFLEVEM